MTSPMESKQGFGSRGISSAFALPHRLLKTARSSMACFSTKAGRLDASPNGARAIEMAYEDASSWVPLGAELHSRLYVDAIAVIVRAVLERPDPLSNSLKGEPAIFYLAVGLGFDANAWALFAYHRRVTALVELAERNSPNTAECFNCGSSGRSCGWSDRSQRPNQAIRPAEVFLTGP